MFKAEWDCTDKMNQFEEEVQEYDRLSEIMILEYRVERRWKRLMMKITAWANLKEGLGVADVCIGCRPSPSERPLCSICHKLPDLVEER